MTMDVDEYDLSEHFPDEPDLEAPVAKSRTGLLKWIKRLAITGIVLVCLAGAAVYLLSELAQREPEFYVQALKVDSLEQRKQGSQMETKLLDLRNSILISETWSAEFTEPQINGWMAFDLRKKFPELVPNGIKDPRVSIKDQTIKLAFRCEVKPFKGIAIIETEIFMTDVLNQVGVKFKSVRSGLIPVPVAAFADQVTAIAQKSGIEIEWKDIEGDPVAMIQLPEKLVKSDDGSYIELETFMTDTGKIAISGRTHPPDF
jgi:hypothetical protein